MDDPEVSVTDTATDTVPAPGVEAPRGRHVWPVVAFAAIAGLVFVADQATKFAVVSSISLYESIPAEGVIRLTHVTNSGSAFGVLQGQTVFLILVSIVGVLGVLFYYRASGRQSALLRIALSLILGGALGNLSDRVIRGTVVDFIDVRLWTDFWFPTFNVADCALTFGMVLLLLYAFKQRNADRAAQSATRTPPTTTTDPSDAGHQ